ncbi:LysM peptidoglycan-binding domain-containing protein [Geodermatophilus sabuli]|uniref:LysM peptidoglycan-binding domain-containing protein n=1 Tax=Geodermatophilus sabuli TaxID=1564158 RepID=A0A7K3VX05_9ACTN|nr:LysM peptidoglycan-binding domain-containing protein [Geodermatophilus sabuli]
MTGPLRPVAERAGSAGRSAVGGPGGAGRPSRRRGDLARPGGRPPRSGRRAGRTVRVGCGSGSAAAPLRLTRRGRRLVAVLAAALAVGVVALGHGLLDDGPGKGLRLAGDRTVVVQPGDTVWSIAAEAADASDDVRGVVDAIQALNGLDDAVVVPGQVLTLP